jgi:hypothetical protein
MLFIGGKTRIVDKNVTSRVPQSKCVRMVEEFA